MDSPILMPIQILPKLWIVCLTAYSDTEILQNALNFGMDETYTKPITRDTLDYLLREKKIAN
jgi:CheY-like chemotaxis protein